MLATPLADLGMNTWPRADHEVLNSLYNKRKIADELQELRYRLVDFVAVELTGRTACQIAVPLLDPIWSLRRALVRCRQRRLALPGVELMPSTWPLQVFALLVLAIYKRHYESEAVDYHIMHVHHKAQTIEHAGQTWWSRSCDAEREAVVFIDPTTAGQLQADRNAGLRRARKPERAPFYLYVGGGCFGQPNFITTFVIRTKDLGLAAAVTAAVRMLGNLENAALPVQVTEDLIMGDPSSEWVPETQEDLMERMKNLWAGVASLDILELFSWDAPRPAPPVPNTRVRAPPGLPPPPPPPAGLQPNLPIDMEEPDAPDWGPDEDEEDRARAPEEPATHTAAPCTPKIIGPLPSEFKVGVDIGGGGGVLLPHTGYTELRAMTTGDDFAPIGFVHGADTWVKQVAAKIGPENFHIISYVAGERLRRVFKEYVFTKLCQPAHVPHNNIHFTDARTGSGGKGKEFVRLKLHCFIDDNSDVLKDIAMASWANDRTKPPQLFLVPTRYHNPRPNEKNTLEKRYQNCQNQVSRCWPEEWGPEWWPSVVLSLGDVPWMLQ